MIYSSTSFKRKLGLVSLFVLGSLSSPDHSFAMDMEEGPTASLSQSMRPNRTKPYKVFSRPEHLYEYFSSPTNRGCGFNIFGKNRHDGIKLIKDNHNKDFIRQYVANEIIYLKKEEKELFKKLFPEFQNQLNPISIFANIMDNQRTYLDYMQNPKSGDGLGAELCTIQNWDDITKSPISDLENSFGLMTAAARLEESNLYVYEKDSNDPNLLHLTHRAVFFPNSLKSRRAIFNGHHYNELIDANDTEANKKALEKENREIQKNTLAIIEMEMEMDIEDHDDTNPTPLPTTTSFNSIPTAKFHTLVPNEPEGGEIEGNEVRPIWAVPAVTPLSDAEIQEFDHFIKTITSLKIESLNEKNLKRRLNEKNLKRRKSTSAQDKEDTFKVIIGEKEYGCEFDKIISLMPENQRKIIQTLFERYSATHHGTQPTKFKMRVFSTYLGTGKLLVSEHFMKMLVNLSAELQNCINAHKNELDKEKKGSVQKFGNISSLKSLINKEVKNRSKSVSLCKESPLFLCLNPLDESELPSYIKKVQENYKKTSVVSAQTKANVIPLLPQPENTATKKRKEPAGDVNKNGSHKKQKISEEQPSNNLPNSILSLDLIEEKINSPKTDVPSFDKGDGERAMTPRLQIHEQSQLINLKNEEIKRLNQQLVTTQANSLRYMEALLESNALISQIAIKIAELEQQLKTALTENEKLKKLNENTNI